jgi:putative restriction endonuclease
VASKHTEVEKRVLQSDFSTAIRYAYDNQCALTGSKVALQAAHWGPKGAWRHENTKGILLFQTLHTVLDQGVLGIDPDTGLVSIAKEHRDDPVLKGLHGKVVHIANLEGPVQELPRFKMRLDCPIRR